MSLSGRLSLVVHSCDKFSDLWDAHFYLLNKNWRDRNIDSFLVTDRETDKKYEGVSVISAGEGKELSERTAAMLPEIKTEYALITLDDYFPIYTISSEKIERIVDIMDREKLDYVRLYLRPKYKRGDKWKEYDKFYRVDPSRRYSVNLYVGIWRKSFIEKTVREPLNAWKYEVSLPKIAEEVGARCAMSIGKEFEILDVVRKGKLLNKANRYLKKHDLYHGDREVISRWYEIKLGIRTWGIRIMPGAVTNFARALMIKTGHHYYSQD